MTDIIERLRGYARDDHERGCNGRYYDCSCGYDKKRDPLLIEAADEIERLRAALEHYASADNWMHIPGGKYQRVWLEPDSSTRDAYDGFAIARAALEGK